VLVGAYVDMVHLPGGLCGVDMSDGTGRVRGGLLGSADGFGVGDGGSDELVRHCKP
jgi:hypothetical protein